ncbi:MAG TPA: aldo/keto reductase [Blastocatellia bacterium]|nr:aldo/keto reductase [Blastocatellia bacterium]HMX24913.1 aldo/keto reductase [Blastocatellia bacterium]HMY71703.1 aldo/keto reductase [Blastocatellia bacterium]HMZ18131.1 aldo/keto reductase [Blastocatellia bacterium]HNG30206.1 aldo/keto reductase [Blastocatellia bacterium]
MQTKQLGNSDLHITPLGIGAWAMGGAGWAFAWSGQDDNQSISAIHAALDAGMNWIDTAAVYGLGHSEEIVAKALAGRANKPYVFTKCARVWDENRQIGKRLKADSVRRECEDSLRRLQVDVIDLYQIHWPEPDEDVEEGWATLTKLKEEGKLRWIGVSNFNAEQLCRAQKIAPITSLQPPYSLIRREVEAEVLPFCAVHNVGVIAYSPMGSGLLTGAMTRERVETLPEDDWRRRGPQFQEPLLTRNLKIADKLKEISARHNRSTGEAALAWVLHNPVVTGAIVGVRNAEQVSGIIGGMDFRLSPDEVAELEAFFQQVSE